MTKRKLKSNVLHFSILPGWVEFCAKACIGDLYAKVLVNFVTFNK